jgi:NAD-dependent deacetylase
MADDSSSNDALSPGERSPAVARAHDLVAEAGRITVLTGAGISTDSGIPDFRGPQGVWTKNPDAEKQATLQNYMTDPEVRRRSWRSRLDHRAFSAEPNAGHRAVVELERQGRLRALITQNIDGLHQASGSTPELVVEVHGTVHEVVCMACEDRAPMQVALDRVRAGEDDPSCRSCGGILKSATISFGQALDTRTLLAAEAAARDCDLMLAVGTTLGVYPVAGVVPLAASHGAKVVILNAEETAFDELADVVVRGQISEVLPQLVAQR